MISELNLRYPEARIGGRSGVYPDSVGSSGLRTLQPRRASSKRLFMGVMFWSSSKPISPLECTLTKNAPVSPLESTLTKLLNLKSPGMNTYKKIGGGGSARLAPPAWCAAEHFYRRGVTMRPSNSTGVENLTAPRSPTSIRRSNRIPCAGVGVFTRAEGEDRQAA